MRHRASVFPALAWLWVASAAAGSVASVADSADPGKLIAAAGWDGRAFLGLDDGLRLQAGILGAHTSTLGGMQARLALAASFYGDPSRNPDDYRPSRIRIGIDELWLRYPFEVLAWPAAVQAGVFRWRFNPDACLGGEYLARLGAYPTTLIRPGLPWEALDSLTTQVIGLRLGAASPEKAVSTEALVLYEKEAEEHRLTLLISGTLQPIRGVEAGAALEILSVADTREPAFYLVPDRLGDTAAPMDTVRMDRASGPRLRPIRGGYRVLDHRCAQA